MQLTLRRGSPFPWALPASAIALACAAALGQGPPYRLAAVPVATGLQYPAFAGAPPADFSRLFICELARSAGIPNRADIRILNLTTGVVNAAPFLTLTINPGPERGLLGMAFDPAYAASGHFYVHYSAANPAGSRIARYQVSPDPNIADPDSAAEVLFAPQDIHLHQGGWIGFGPDDNLYINLGDVTSSANGQGPRTLFGKILRIDVHSLPYTIPPTNPFFGSTVAREEIWSLGLRNPFRASFDRLTGDLWISDPGPTNFEEINLLPAGLPTPANFGWSCAVGPLNSCGVPVIAPVHYWPHVGTGSDYPTGGYVYRGAAIPDLRGSYFFFRRGTNTVWSLRHDGTQVTELIDRTVELTPAGGALQGIVSFGEDAAGELYMMALGGLSATGVVYRIEPRCRADCDGSVTAPALTLADFECFQGMFMRADPYADCNGVGGLTIADFGCFQTAFVAGCP